MMSLYALLSVALLASTASVAAGADNSVPELRSLRGEEEERSLQGGGNSRPVDFFFPEDICQNGENDFGVCDQSRFPQCEQGKTRICYNRRPMRDNFYADNRQPLFYIDYDVVFCYSDSWEGCSSCSPGRYCSSEARCIIDEIDYPCAQWI